MVDSRAGSADLYPSLKAAGMPVELCQLDYGDVAFLGNGPDGLVPVGIEYKKIGDAIDCMLTGRLAGHQLIGMRKTYQQRWLLIEGTKWNSKQQHGRPIRKSDWWHWLMSIQIIGGTSVWTTDTEKESVAWIAELYTWWQKSWDEHRSMNVVYTGPDYIAETDGGIFSQAIRENVSLRRLWAMQLPGIGSGKSKVVEQVFTSALELANADEKMWLSIDGIGKTLATKIYNAIRR